MKITIEGTEQEIKSILSTIGSSQEDKNKDIKINPYEKSLEVISIPGRGYIIRHPTI
ncbi:hypothetical protein P0E61_09920 [Enterococcus faecalis]|uniref:hypothetical protein n=1 Tax=Enterococcus faecalis TaxID=1351 RepID=UPI0019295E5F|nr:hypothetical protein [Enterococcus faecalis]MDN3100660.1 hypothetical protein [Enterococcus faecalis]MDN3103438.1 hypothetical protein [Enterococcus faecalis]